MMIETGFPTLERRRAGENLLTVLYGDHTPRRERVAVTAAIDLIDDRSIEVTAAQKISVQRVDFEIVDSLICGHERLTEHLAAVDLRTADVTALAAKQIDLEALELELFQQIGDTNVHVPATPSRFCITGLVVVYCRNCFFSGYNQLWMPKAANAAS